MDTAPIITAIVEGAPQYLPLYRVIWAVTAGLGLNMLFIALILKRNPTRKNHPWWLAGLVYC